MILNTTMWVDARLGLDIQKEIAFTYANVLAVMQIRSLRFILMVGTV